MAKKKIRIENPASEAAAFTSPNRARHFVRDGRAIFIDPQTIRFVAHSQHVSVVDQVAEKIRQIELSRIRGVLDRGYESRFTDRNGKVIGLLNRDEIMRIPVLMPERLTTIPKKMRMTTNRVAKPVIKVRNGIWDELWRPKS